MPGDAHECRSIDIDAMMRSFPRAAARVCAPGARSRPVLASATPTEEVIKICEWASSHGTLGLGAYAATHAAAVVVCFPATILFEIAAGFAFGIYQGALVAWAAKVFAAIVTFLVSSGFARQALSSAGLEEAASRAFSAEPSLARLAQSVEREGARYTLLARLSPIPSWLNNYGLAFAGVRFGDYVPATALATLPAVLTHVYAGSLLSSLIVLMDGDGGAAAATLPTTLASTALGGVSVVGGALLLRELAGALAAGDLPAEELSEEELSEEELSEEELSEEEVQAPAAQPQWRRSGDPKALLPADEGQGSAQGGACADEMGAGACAGAGAGAGAGADADATPSAEATLLLEAWRAVRDRAPSLLTGAGPTDGEADPAAALFNTFLIRLPFLAVLGALVANLLLGGGVAIGGVEWPPPPAPAPGGGGLWSSAAAITATSSPSLMADGHMPLPHAASTPGCGIGSSVDTLLRIRGGNTWPSHAVLLRSTGKAAAALPLLPGSSVQAAAPAACVAVPAGLRSSGIGKRN